MSGGFTHLTNYSPELSQCGIPGGRARAPAVPIEAGVVLIADCAEESMRVRRARYRWLTWRTSIAQIAGSVPGRVSEKISSASLAFDRYLLHLHFRTWTIIATSLRSGDGIDNFQSISDASED